MTDAAILTQSTLVLNRSWIAITTTTVRDALSMLYTGSARAVQPETFEVHEFDSWASLAIEPDHPDGKKFHEKVSKALRSKHEDIGKRLEAMGKVIGVS